MTLWFLLSGMAGAYIGITFSFLLVRGDESILRIILWPLMIIKEAFKYIRKKK